MNNPKWELLKVHFRSFFREPAIIFWAILFPIIMAWVLGLAFTEKPEVNKTVYVVGKSESLDSLANKTFLVPGLDSPVKLLFLKKTEEEAITSLKRGSINVYLQDQQGELQFHYDPINPDAVNTHLMIEKLIFHQPSRKTEIKAITTKGNRYIDFLIPGLIALGIMNSAMWGISYNLIEFRMKKLLRRMIATPMKKSDFLISHFLFRVIICVVETALLLLFAFGFFGVDLQGSWFAFFLLFLSGVICFTGIAILIASRTQNTQIGNGLINAVILPMTVLSGIFFSYHNFPSWAENFIRFLPLTILADNIRKVFIEGAGLEAALLPIVILTSVGLSTYFIGIRIFKWY